MRHVDTEAAGWPNLPVARILEGSAVPITPHAIDGATHARRRDARAVTTTVFLLSLVGAAPAPAATFNAFVGFGDSEIDSGWWKNALAGQCGAVAPPCATSDPDLDHKIQSAINDGGTGTAVGIGQMNSQLIAAHYGVTALPANGGGTNYAIGGTLTTNATGSGNVHPNAHLPSTVQQMATYLMQNGNVANPNALYVISTGGNDVTYASNNFSGNLVAQEGFLKTQADALVAAIKTLQMDGAATIVVYGLKTTTTLATYWTQTLFADLAAANVNFIDADIAGLLQTVQADPAAYGLLTVDPGIAGDSNTPSACVAGSGATGWGQRCGLDPSPDHAHLRDPNAEMTSLYSDDQHFSAAGQQIEANYVISLIDGTTPLPSALPLFATGLGGIGYFGWRRKRKSANAA
jgi:outer membrane lipase/esterase